MSLVLEIWILATAPRLHRVITYRTQPDYPVSVPEKVAPGAFCVYLDVWERHITYVEDDSIREVALGGPDTATRAKIVWQVKVMHLELGPVAIELPCLRVDQLRTRLQPDNRGRLKAMAKQDAPATDPCLVPPSASYRGPENQLYRVEVHRAGVAWDGKTGTMTSAATFTWSRENSSVVFAISSMATDSTAHTTTLTLESLGKDDRLGLDEGDWWRSRTTTRSS